MFLVFLSKLNLNERRTLKNGIQIHDSLTFIDEKLLENSARLKTFHTYCYS